jgi:hypothetical protein
MLAKIITGLIIGFVSGFFLVRNDDKNESFEIIVAFIAIVSIGFIGSSFMYGAVYGLMAIGEIVVGFSMASSIFKKDKEQ